MSPNWKSPLDFIAKLAALIKKSFPELYARLLTIPSVGPKTALELIVISDGFRRFDNVKGLCAYEGVSPTTYRSGTSIKGKGGITKLGQGRLRQAFAVVTTIRSFLPKYA